MLITDLKKSEKRPIKYLSLIYPKIVGYNVRHIHSKYLGKGDIPNNRGKGKRKGGEVYEKVAFPKWRYLVTMKEHIFMAKKAFLVNKTENKTNIFFHPFLLTTCSTFDIRGIATVKKKYIHKTNFNLQKGTKVGK